MTPRSMDKTASRVSADSDSIRILQQFAEMYRSGAQGAAMDCNAAQVVALSIDDVLRSLSDSVSDGSKGVLFEIADKTGKEPCGECHLQPGETCDICNAHEPTIALDSGTGGQQPVAYVADYRKSDGTTDYFVMLGCDGREMSLHMHRIRGRAEYEAAEINHIISGSPKPEFDDFDVDAPTEPKAGVVSEDRAKLLAEVISLIEDDMYGPGETGEVEERIAFNKALRRQINRITSRMIARAALPNTTGEAE